MLDQAKEYLARVIPWPQPGEHGFVNIHWTFPPKTPRADGKPAWAGRAVTSMAEASRALEFALKSPDTLGIYACMSLQAQANPKVSGVKKFKYNAPLRLAQNAVSLRSFFLDIDLKPVQLDPAGVPLAVQKGYATWDELVTALAGFIHKMNLPKPSMMVHSGGGVHVYWIVDRALTPQEWLPLTHALANATRIHGLRCDTQCTVDSARVLRIPDTFNRKLGLARNVSFIGKPVDFDYSVARIASTLSTYQTVVPSAVASVLGAAVDRILFPPLPPITGPSGLEVTDADLWPAIDLDLVRPVCGFLDASLTNGGATNDNPLWNLTTLISSFTKGGRSDAHRMADKHAAYSQTETDALFDRKDREKAERGLGWPSCGAIAAAGAAACGGCAFRAQGKSPLNFEQRSTPSPAGHGALQSALARNAAGTAPAAAPVPTVFGGAVAAAPQPVRQLVHPAPQAPPPANDLPVGYTRAANGVIEKIVADPANPGGNITIPISGYPMLNAWLQNDPKVLHFESVVERNKVTQIDLPFEVAATNEMRKCLQSQGVMISPTDKYLGEFFVAWINELQKVKDMVTSSPFGWLNTSGHLDGFVFGDRLWTPRGDEPAATPNIVLAHRYRPKGSDTYWVDAAKLVTLQGRPDLEAIVASAFAAPLVQFTGHKGALMSAYSRESGIGKSTAVTIAQAVWGNPVKGVQGLTDTENAVMGIVGEIKSLPLYWDELKTDTDTKKFVKMTFQISSGKGKSRMDSRAQLKEPGDWQTLVVSASNESLIDHVTSQTNTTSAGLMRIFEYKVMPSANGQVSTSDATIRLSKLNNNYGHVGLKYAKFLGANHAQIASEMHVLASSLETETGADQEERFWIALIATVLLGARYAEQIGYAVFDHKALKSFMVQSLAGMREHRRTQTVDLDKSINVSAILNRFFNDVKKNGSWLVTSRIHVGAGKPPRHPSPHAVIIMQPDNGSKLNGIDVQVGVANNLLRISRSALSHWCKKNEINFINLIEALGRAVTITAVKNARMGAGTNWASANDHIIEIDITSSHDLDFVQDMI